MKTNHLLLIATLLLFIVCPYCFSQNKGYMTSYRNADGKALIITEKYLYLVDGQGKEEIYGCDVSVDDPNTLWVYQLNGCYDHVTVTLKADGSLVYDEYSSSSVCMVTHDLKISRMLTIIGIRLSLRR